MAFIRGLSTRASLVKRRYSPSFSYILHDDRENRAREDTSVQDIKSNLSQWRSFGSSLNSFAAYGLTHPRRCLGLALSPSIGAAFCRNMSTTVGGGSDKIELMSDVLIDPSVTAAAVQTPAVNEVAVAAADSFLPVAALQHVIDAIHSFTGFNWWASIVLTTLVIRGVTLPFVINQLKATSKLTLLRPHLEQIKQEMQDKGMEPDAVADGQKRMKALFNEYGVSVFTPVKGLLIQGPVFISFFLAISNMVEKVPSFKNGGAYWFVDLTTPDSMYILPALTALTFWITVECNMQEGMEGNPAGKTMKNISRVLAVATVPLTSGFPKAIFCYWITSNIFSFTYGLALKVPGVKKALGIPEIPVNPSKAAPESPFNMLSALKKATATQASAASSSIESSSLSKVADQRKSSSSSVSQRLTSLEKQVKAKKKNKKR